MHSYLKSLVSEKTRKLFECEIRYKLLIDSITSYVFTVTLDNGIPVKTTHGPHCIGITCYSAKEFEDDSYLWLTIVHKDDRDMVQKQIDKLIN